MSLFAIWNSEDGTWHGTKPRQWVSDLEYAHTYDSQRDAQLVADLYEDASVVEVDECEAGCQALKPIGDMALVEVARATMSSPAEYAYLCNDCADKYEAAYEDACERKGDLMRDGGW